MQYPVDTPNTLTCYVVQKCWFDGPHVSPPVDFRGLFVSQRCAEEVAHASAHLYGRAHHSAVRTILLAQKSYAFSTAGVLFWVRPVVVTGMPDEPQAHVILTGGVLGGTGNRNSRRGSEISTDRVFGGPQAADMAYQALQTLPSNLRSLSSRTVFPVYTKAVPHEALPDGWKAWPHGGQSIVPNVEDEQNYRPYLPEERPSKRHCIGNNGQQQHPANNYYTQQQFCAAKPFV